MRRRRALDDWAQSAFLCPIPGNPTRRTTSSHPGGHRDSDDTLLTDLTAPPSLEDAQEAYDYWSKHRSELPRHKRHKRNEAEQMAIRWKQRLEAARREKCGPGLVDQLLDTPGIRWRPNPHRIIVGVSAFAIVALLIVVVLVALVIVLWPEIGPVVNTPAQQGDGGGGGG